MFFLLSAFANTPDSLQDYFESLEELRVHDDLYRRVDKPIRIRDGAMTVTIRDGYLIPVFSGRFSGDWDQNSQKLLKKLRRQDKDAELPDADDRGSKEMVGFIWTQGEGEVKAALTDRADAMRFANYMVARMKEDAATWAPVVEKRAFTVPATEGLFLGIDPVLEKRFLAQGGGSEDPYEVIVYPDGPPDGALRRAKTLLEQRVTLLDNLRIDVAENIALDRTEEDRGIGDERGKHAVFDVHTTQRYGRVIVRKDGNPSEDQWLTNVRDDRGSMGRWRSSLFTVGRYASYARKARISGLPFDAEDRDAQRKAPVFVEPVFAKAMVRAQPRNNGMVLEVEFETELTMRAVGGAALWVDLDLPKVEAIPDSFEVVEVVNPDGVNLLAADRELREIATAEDEDIDLDEDDPMEEATEDADEKKMDRKPAPLEIPGVQTLAFLPEAVPAGEEFVVKVKWKDTWPLGKQLVCSSSIVRPSGASTGLQYFLPSPSHGDPGSPWRFEAAIAVPESSKLYSAMSGVTTKTETKDGWRITWSSPGEVSALWPGVAVGKFKNIVDPPQKEMPGVTARLVTAFPGELEGFPPEARRVVDYYQRWLPPFPVQEIEVFEAPSSCYGYVWIAPHGMVNLARMVTGGEVRGTDKHLEHATFSHEIAHQYWGHLARPASVEDFWIAESFSEGFACMYLGAAFDPKDCEKRMTQARKYWERRPEVWGGIASLTEAYTSPEQGQIVYEYGPYVMHEMLRRRIGKEAYFAALDVMLREHGNTPITTERLQHYFQAASGKDLTAFFDYWVHQGLVPAVRGSWDKEGKAVVGTLSSDVPFGTFDIPVVVTEKDRVESQWIEVVDGQASFRFEGPWKKPKVELDPTFATLARKRAMSRE